MRKNLIKLDESRTDVGKVKPGDLMAFVYYATVKQTSVYGGDAHLLLKDNDTETEFEVHGRALIEKSFSADQFNTEEKVTKTVLAEILIKSFNVPFTVTFIKADGTERRLRGRLIKSEPLLGRSQAEDLDKPLSENRLRLVDHRTLKTLIVNGVKYVLKD